jgi:putative Mg2+ transporter-C (MgtC) family protein
MACGIGSLIGLERESNNRDAGLRTHVVLCVTSAMVMCMSEYIFFKYSNASNFDPARMGAEVVKGIGFLGAGCIINEKLSSKGLTTAAGLWVSACIGIAVGSGLYTISFITTGILLITLMKLKKFKINILKKNKLCLVLLKLQDTENVFVDLSILLKDMKIKLKDITFLTEDKEQNTIIKVLLKVPNSNSTTDLIDKISNIPEVIEAGLI